MLYYKKLGPLWFWKIWDSSIWLCQCQNFYLSIFVDALEERQFSIPLKLIEFHCLSHYFEIVLIIVQLLWMFSTFSSLYPWNLKFESQIVLLWYRVTKKCYVHIFVYVATQLAAGTELDCFQTLLISPFSRRLQIQ